MPTRSKLACELCAGDVMLRKDVTGQSDSLVGYSVEEVVRWRIASHRIEFDGHAVIVPPLSGVIVIASGGRSESKQHRFDLTPGDGVAIESTHW